MSEYGSASQALRRRTPTAVLGLLAVVAYAVIAVFALFNAQTFTAEVSALARGWWYAAGVTPYSAADIPPDMPLYFYEVGYWQRLLGPGHVTARLLSVLLGAVSGLLLFTICRRLTANVLVAAAAAFIFLATPSTAFFFATATPAATVSALHLLAVFLIVDSLGRPRVGATVLMGVVCALIYFTRQDMALGIVVLVPLYIAALGRDRPLHTLIIVAAFAALAASLILLLPARFHVEALKLPLIGGMLGDAGLFGPDYILVSRGTYGPAGIGSAFEGANLKGLLESFVLPNIGTLFLSLAVFFAAKGPLRVLWAAPLYFLWLVGAHYVTYSARDACEACLQPVTPEFAAVGALAAAIALAMSGRWAKQNGWAPGSIVVVGALTAVILNTFAPALAAGPATRAFPRPLLDGVTAVPEIAEIPVLTRWVAAQLKTKQPALVIHGLGRADLPALPFAVIAAGHVIPPVSLDLKGTHRTINTSLVGDMRATVRRAVESDGLWSDDVMRRWIESDYNVILLQEDSATAELKTAIEARFDAAGATRYRGRNILLYTRKTAP